MFVANDPANEKVAVYECLDCHQQWQDDEVNEYVDVVGGRLQKVGHCPCCDTANLMRVK